MFNLLILSFILTFTSGVVLACDGPMRVSGEIVVGDTIQEVLDKLERKQV